MAIKRMAVTLHEDELVRLRQIIDNEDAAEALKFVREVLEPNLKKAERSSGMQRSFDSGSPPGLTGGTLG